MRHGTRDGERATGTVVWFSRRRGRGVIEGDGAREEFLVERRAFYGSPLRAGDRVEFDGVRKGRGLVAKRVSVIHPSGENRPAIRVGIRRGPGPRRFSRSRTRLLRFGRL